MPFSEESFWRRVTKGDPSECWLWTGSKDTPGYGRVQIDKKQVCAHRMAYELCVGPIPDGLELDHLCRVPLCVNPEHLEPVTRRENLLRGNTVPARRAAQTHCLRGHAFDEANTYVDARGRRGCRACGRLRAKRYYSVKIG